MAPARSARAPTPEAGRSRRSGLRYSPGEMTTRTIVTSQPDVACDVCTRRLLRGEQPDVFLAAGRRRLVCELCAPRAIHEGWLRETEPAPASIPELRSRRGRTLLGRLRQVARPATGANAAAELAPAPEAGLGAEPYDFLDDPRSAATVPVPARAPAQPAEPAAEQAPGENWLTSGADAPPSRAASVLELAVEAFNASEHPRRVLGVARSLGAPEVSVRSAEHALSVVVIVVAWELCWYRYQVDVDERPLEVHLAGEGSELGELSHEERAANALVLDSGLLALAGG